MLEAESQFRKVIGYSDLARLAVADQRDLAAPTRHHIVIDARSGGR
jgi:hypothetical protein